MHNHVNTKGIDAMKSNWIDNELKSIEDLAEEASGNNLQDFLSGLPYILAGIVLIKDGAEVEVEDPRGLMEYGFVYQDEVELIIDLCQNYETLMGSFDPTTGSRYYHSTAVVLSIEAYNLKGHLLNLHLEYTDRGLGVDLSATAFSAAGFSWADDQETVFTAVGSYAGTRLPCGGVSLSVFS